MCPGLRRPDPDPLLVSQNAGRRRREKGCPYRRPEDPWLLLLRPLLDYNGLPRYRASDLLESDRTVHSPTWTDRTKVDSKNSRRVTSQGPLRPPDYRDVS